MDRYLLIPPVNNGTLRCFTDSLQDGCLACICPSYNKDTELDLWKTRTGLLGVHWSDGGVCVVNRLRSIVHNFTRSNFLIYRTVHHRRRPTPPVVQPGSGKSILDFDSVVKYSQLFKAVVGITPHYQVVRATALIFLRSSIHIIPPADSVLYYWVALSGSLRYHRFHPEYTGA
jgi:hypothetical protein